jgi:hypothetical protein
MKALFFCAKIVPMAALKWNQLKIGPKPREKEAGDLA